MVLQYPNKPLTEQCGNMLWTSSREIMYVEHAVGFIDGAVIAIARHDGRDSNEHSVYNGHKRNFARKFQASIKLNGFCAHLYGLDAGCRNDMFLYTESGADKVLENEFHINEKRPFTRTLVIQCAPSSSYRMVVVTQPISKIAFNASLSRVRFAAEWLLKKVKAQWLFVDYFVFVCDRWLVASTIQRCCLPVSETTSGRTKRGNTLIVALPPLRSISAKNKSNVSLGGSLRWGVWKYHCTPS